jgi:hypothetical protein
MLTQPQPTSSQQQQQQFTGGSTTGGSTTVDQTHSQAPPQGLSLPADAEQRVQQLHSSLVQQDLVQELTANMQVG